MTNDLHDTHRSGGHFGELVDRFWSNVAVYDVDVRVAIAAVLFVPEAERVHHFVNDGALAVAAVGQRDCLPAADAADRTVASFIVDKSDVIVFDCSRLESQTRVLMIMIECFDD